VNKEHNSEDCGALPKGVGLPINFNVPVLKNGLKRMVNHDIEPDQAPENSAPSATSGVDADLRSPRNLSDPCVSAVKEDPTERTRIPQPPPPAAQGTNHAVHTNA
jgi:hypothetical protein